MSYQSGFECIIFFGKLLCSYLLYQFYFLTKKFFTMGNLLYVIAVILIIVWLFGAFITPFGGGLIHILLVIAIIVIILRVIRGAA